VISHYYIYYTVTPRVAESLRTVVAAMQREIAARTGVSWRLLCGRDNPETWMEVYENVTDAQTFDTALATALQHVRFTELLGPTAHRSVEIFRPL
jgi:hypothetical protein